MTGIVYKSTGSWYSIKAQDGTFYDCRIKGKFRIQGIKSTNPLAVGDVVDFDLETSNNTQTGVINTIHPGYFKAWLNFLAIEKELKIKRFIHV